MKQKDILFLLIPVALLVAAWIGFNIFHNLATSTISSTLNTNILPITPNFDIKTISNLKQREKVVPLFQLQKIETPTPSPLPIPTASPTPTPTLIPTPTSKPAPNASITP